MRNLLPALLLLSCGGPQDGGELPEPTRKLDEARAFEIMLGAFGEMDLQAEQNRTLKAGGTKEFDVDLAVPGKPAAVEYMDDLDRAALEGLLPARRGDTLRIMAAQDPRDASREVQVLIIEDRDYVFDPNPERSGGERSPTVQEVEGRLRRDIIDFLQYAKHEGLCD